MSEVKIHLYFALVSMSLRASRKAVRTVRRIQKSLRVIQKRRRKKLFATYILNLLREIRPSTCVTIGAMSMMNSFVHSILLNAADFSRFDPHYHEKSTITSREIETAFRRVFPAQFAKKAIPKCSE